MVAIINHQHFEEDFLAHVTDIAYQALLRQGIRRSFLDVELTLWQQIRSAYHARRPDAVSLEGDR